MIVWGGTDFNTTFNSGGRYNPGTNSWTATNTTNAPAARGSHTAVWTGTQMIISGGEGNHLPLPVLNTGGRYNPGTNSWMANTKAAAKSGAAPDAVASCVQ